MSGRGRLFMLTAPWIPFSKPDPSRWTVQSLLQYLTSADAYWRMLSVSEPKKMICVGLGKRFWAKTQGKCENKCVRNEYADSHFFSHANNSSCMTLHLIPSKFPHIKAKFPLVLNIYSKCASKIVFPP